MFTQHKGLRACLLASAAIAIAAPALAQEASQEPANQPSSVDEVVVTGLRATQRNSIAEKRNSAVIVDAIVNDDVGSLPDNSIGDTLERVTGVTADRFKGNANELSVRGLGPTLSFSTFNGREVSTAGPDRSVAFQQFPSELVSGVLVYKTQQADMPEGGIAGVIELRSIRPLDAKPRLQLEYRGVYQEKDAAINGRDGLGYRANVSWTNRWLNTGIGDLGLSLGYQHQDQASPEDYYTTNSAFIPCNTDALNPSLITGTAAAQTAAGASFNCGLRNNLSAAQRAGTTDAPLYFATTSRTFRQISTAEERDGFMGALQWRPTDRLDFMLDTQYSKRSSLENRNQLAITEAARGIEPITIGDGDRWSEGALISYRGNSNLEIQNEDRQRDEEYKAVGLSGAWNGDRLRITGDLSYSESHRTELQKSTNMRSPTRVAYMLDATDDVVPNVTFSNFDISNPSSFLTTAPAANTNYARYRKVTDRKDEIAALRFDGVYDLSDGGFFRTLNAGVRYSEHSRNTDLNNNTDINIPIARDGMTAAQIVAKANADCRTAFPTSEFMPGSSTNIRSWATFDNNCLFRAYTGADSSPLMADSRGPEDINVKETISAIYAMTTFGGEFRNTPFSGNMGLRYVKTEVDSRGYRSAVLVTPSIAGSAATITTVPGTLTEIRGTGEYDYWLPSANLNFDLNDKTRLRFGASRSIARSGIEDFNVGINPLPDTTATTVQGVLANSQTGNPNLKPLDSWNLDTSLEFYLNKDTAFSFAVYHKWIKNASFDAVQPFTTSIIANGVETSFNAVAPANDTEQRQLTGFEVTASTVFSSLPGLWSGLGASAGYNYADADFEFPDPSSVAAYVDPAGLRGLSRHNANASLFWEGEGLQLRAAYRYRSDYSKPNSSTNRSVRGSGILNLSANYNVTRNVQLKLQALNVTNARDILYKPGYDAVTEVSESNPQYYFGVRFRY